MHETYEERRFCVGPGEWEGQVEKLRAAAGDSCFGVFRGQIGLEANEGVLLTVYPDAAKLALSVGSLRGLAKTSAAGPSSTTFPCRITISRLASAFTTFRSCEMKR